VKTTTTILLGATLFACSGLAPWQKAEAQTVDALQLINANTDAVIRPLLEGAVIDLAADGNNLAIRGDATGAGSLRFVLSGTESLNRIESSAPYAVHGDAAGDYNVWTPALGAYSLTTTPYSGAGASGSAGTAVIRNFSVVNTGTPPPPPPASSGAFVEIGGLVVMEAESQPVVGNWDLNTSVAGYTGDYYIEWKTGDPFTGAIAAGTDIITYEVLITNPGRYRLQIRSAAPNRTEHNDVWVRFPDNGALREKGGVYTSLGTAYVKCYQNVDNDTWTWNSSTVDNNPHNIYTDFPAAGVYRFQFSGRSTKFKIDRIVLYDASNTTAFATSLSRPESPRNTITAENDTDNLLEDGSVITDVLANDSDPDGTLDPSSVIIITAPDHGNTNVLADGRIGYQPDANYFGADSYVYRVCNTSGACAQAAVSLTIASVNDAPTVLANSDSTGQDVAVTTFVLANDGDIDGTLVPSSVTIVTAPLNGTALASADGSITYTPNTGYFGVDGYLYSVCDNQGACAQAGVTVQISENATPICDAPINLTATLISPTSAVLSWDPVANADGYQFQGRRIGSTWRNRGTSSTSLNFNVFSPGDTYEFRVRAFCFGSTVTSDFGGPQSFTMPTTRLAHVSTTNWSLTPNPAQTYIDLTGIPSTVNTVSATDLSGRLVGQWNLQGDTRIGVSQLEPGMYLIQLSDDQGRSAGVRTMVVQR